MMIDFYRFEMFEAQKGCRHAVTTKVPDQPYGFSVALHTGEDEKQIVQNRKKIIECLKWYEPLHFVIGNQTHSDNIVIIDKPQTQGWESMEDAIANCDALITDQKNVVLSVLTADCVPVLLYDRKKEVIAAVHAGWKGTKAKIVAKTVQKMVDRFGSDAKDIIAGIAPSIGACCYEVGEDVAGHFVDYPQALEKKGAKYMLDLPKINQEQLLHAGVLESHVAVSHICTACEVDRFFSYRQEEGCSGRFMSMIVLV